MKNLRASTFLLSLFGVLFIYSCVSNEAQKLESSDILGRWILKEAYRGGKSTSTLEKVYFEFLENRQLKTNFNIEFQDQTVSYEVKERNIFIKGDSNLNIKAAKDLDDNLIFDSDDAAVSLKTRVVPHHIFF